MPPGLRGFVCPPGSPTVGERHDAEFCMGQCAHPCVAQPLIAAIHHSNQQNPHKGAYLSASLIAGTNCGRKVFYERHDPNGYYELLRNCWWPFRGTIAHKIIEDRGETVARFGWMQEIKFTIPLAFPDEPAPIFDEHQQWTGAFDPSRPLIVTLGGTCDAYNPYLRVLLDFKTAQDRVINDALAGKLKPEWEEQTNIYSYLISKTRITPEHRATFARLGLPELEGEFFPKPERIAIQMISLMEPVLTGTNHQLMRQKDIRAVPSVRVMSNDETEAMIRSRALYWYRVLVLKQLPPVVEQERAWLCRGCTFNGEVIDGERCLPGAERKAHELTQIETPKAKRKPRAKKTKLNDLFG